MTTLDFARRQLTRLVDERRRLEAVQLLPKAERPEKWKDAGKLVDALEQVQADIARVERVIDSESGSPWRRAGLA